MSRNAGCFPDAERREVKNSKHGAAEVSAKDMEKYDWSKKILISVGKKWVYYRVPKKETGKIEPVKLFYDPMYDWEFEHEKY